MNQAYLTGRLNKKANQLLLQSGCFVDLLIPPDKEKHLTDIQDGQFVQIKGEIYPHCARVKSAVVRVTALSLCAGDPSPSSFVSLNLRDMQWMHQVSFNKCSSVYASLQHAKKVHVQMPLSESRWAKCIGDRLTSSGDADIWASFTKSSQLLCDCVVDDRTGQNDLTPLPPSTCENNPQKGRKKTSRKGIPPKLRHEIFLRDNFTCKNCGASPRKDRAVVIEVDHIHPVSKGGTNEKNNLQTLCDACNSGKSDSIIPPLSDPWE